MKWNVTGANRETGEDRTLVIEADNKDSAIRRAGRQGILVADAVPLLTTPPRAAAASPSPTVCGNCERVIGKLETPRQHAGHVVCPECFARLTQPPPTAAVRVTTNHSPSGVYAVPPEGEYRALGLSSRKMCWVVVIIGLLTCWTGIGLLLIVWGFVAEYMIVKHNKQMKLNAKVLAATSLPSSTPAADPHAELRRIHAGVKSMSMD